MKCTPCSTAVPDAIVKKVVPEMQRVQKILNTMELSRKATSEHKKKKQQDKWRKEVITLLKRIQQKRCA
jgi:NADH:ubiquinone oxidoreductase subunit E